MQKPQLACYNWTTHTHLLYQFIDIDIDIRLS